MRSDQREPRRAFFGDSKIRWSIGLIVGTGFMLGILWAWREFLTKPPPNEFANEESPGVESASGFGQFFSLFFLGRTGDQSRVRRSSPLVRAAKFLPNERVGIRAETADSVHARFAIDLRFLTRATREEPVFLMRYRQRISINPGRWSYCCVRIPKEAGYYDVGLLVDGSFVGYLPVQVKAPLQYQGEKTNS